MLTQLIIKTTYSFKIYPIAETLSSNEYYNLVYEKIGTEWNEIIFFNTEKTNPTDARKLESSEIVYNRVSGRDGFTEVITYSIQCNGSCSGVCDGFACPTGECIKTTITYVYTGIEDTGDGSNGNPPGSGNPPSNGGGGGEGNGIYIPNPYDGEADPNNADFMLAGQVASFTNTLPNNLQTLISNYPFVYPYLVDFCRNNGYTVNSRNTQKMTTALTNFYNFQLNTSYTNLTFVNIDKFNFWAFYTFLNNNPLDVNNTKINDIKDFVQASDHETANSIVGYLFENKEDEETVDNLLALIDLSNSGQLISFFPNFKYPVGSNYSTLYPNFTILVKEYIPILKNDTRLINTIHNLTGVSNSDIKDDLTWGNGPEINIVQLGLDPDGNQYYGKFNKNEPDKIYIDIDLVIEVESLSNITNPTQEQTNKLAFLNAMITFSVCLHEYVHYNDFAFDGTMQDNENLELGLLFEELYLGGFYEFDPNNNVIFIKKN